MEPAKRPRGSTCALWLPKKKRYCHFAVVDGYEYCGHHLAARAEGTGARIPCPLDASHSIFASDLQRHLKVCPKVKEAREEAALPCFRRDVNVGLVGTLLPGKEASAGALVTATTTAMVGQPLHASLAEVQSSQKAS